MEQIRCDSIPVKKTFFTPEGYLVDNPIVTRVGIFEYAKSDGGIRRELRLPEEVFSEESLASYEGKPIIITHDAGKVDKDNVDDESIGTILSKGYKDGNAVRAKIVIHDTDSMKQSGLKELSLGYTLELDETPGVWNGQPYDAVQKNILINHLALVQEARAGDSARLNIDGKDNKGGNSMTRKKKRYDTDDLDNPVLQGEESSQDEDDTDFLNENGDSDSGDPDGSEETAADEGDIEEDPVQLVKDRRDRRDSEGEPEDKEAAVGIIAQQDEDIDILLKYIEQLLAKRDFDEADVSETKAEENADENEEENGSMNSDSVDAMIRTRVELAKLGEKLRLDGLENMSVLNAKKAVIKAVRPKVRLDGRSDVYVQAMYDIAKEEIASRKSTADQRRQMFNGDGKGFLEQGMCSADKARERMIKNKMGGNK